jgi:hypothetical protein
MMAKLNVASSLSSEAQVFLATYEKHLARMSESDAAEATIEAIYRTYYTEMGGAGSPPDSKIANPKPPKPTAAPDVFHAANQSRTTQPDNVISMRAWAQRPKPTVIAGQKPRLPVALIFVCLVAITVALHYLLQ